MSGGGVVRFVAIDAHGCEVAPKRFAKKHAVEDADNFSKRGVRAHVARIETDGSRTVELRGM